jgi:SP family sugar:H+ symporter-like MFS transporter
MGIPSRLHLPFGGRNSSSTEGEISHPEKHVYHNAPPIPRVTIHSFIMGVFVSMGGKLSYGVQ